MNPKQVPFTLDSRLFADTIALGEWPLCRVLMMNDRRYPWLILVPRRPGLVELTDLDETDSAVLWQEIRQAGRVLAGYGDKVNTGALGNVVAQLHVHVIARRVGDPAWPGPVWGHSPREPWAPDEGAAAAARLAAALGL